MFAPAKLNPSKHLLHGPYLQDECASKTKSLNEMLITMLCGIGIRYKQSLSFG